MLSEKEEALLAEASEVLSSSSNTFSVLNNADITFPSIKDEEGNEKQITHGNFINFLESENREVRKNAFDAVYKTYGQYKNTMATTLSGTVKKTTSTQE